MNEYKTLKEKHKKEVNSFPMVFAFNNDQFKEGMEKLGLTEKDTNKVVSIGAGGFIRKDDVKAYKEMFKRMDEEIQSAIDSDTTGEGFIKDMFYYELANHEYGYSQDLTDTLNALNLTMEDINNNPALLTGLKLAEKECLSNIEW